MRNTSISRQPALALEGERKLSARTRFRSPCFTAALVVVLLASCQFGTTRDDASTAAVETSVLPATRGRIAFTHAAPKKPATPARAGADATVKSADEPGELKLLFAGDTHFQWGVGDLQKRSGRLSPVASLLEVFAAADFRAVNLETSIADQGKPFVRKSYIFNTPPENLKVLEAMQLDLALLGNNHSMDMGQIGMERTVRALRRAGIGAVGVGNNTAEAFTPYRFSLGGVRFAVLSASGIGERATFATRRGAGVAAMNQQSALIAAVRAAKRRADQVIVSLHWGNEYAPRADVRQTRLARALVNAGATAVIGHHPHVPQGIELYRGAVICYSLGNFLFGSINEDQSHNMLVQLEIGAKSKVIHRARVIPVTGRHRDTGDHRLTRLAVSEQKHFWEDLYVLSRDLSPAGVEGMRVLGDGTATFDVQPPKIKQAKRADAKAQRD